MIGIEDGEAAGPFGQGGKNLLVGGSGFWKLRHDGTRLVHGIVETVDRIASAIADSRGAGAAAAGCAACSGSSRSTLTTGACSASPACSPATASSASCATGSTCSAAASASTRSALTRSARRRQPRPCPRDRQFPLLGPRFHRFRRGLRQHPFRLHPFRLRRPRASADQASRPERVERRTVVCWRSGAAKKLLAGGLWLAGDLRPWTELASRERPRRKQRRWICYTRQWWQLVRTAAPA